MTRPDGGGQDVQAAAELGTADGEPVCLREVPDFPVPAVRRLFAATPAPADGIDRRAVPALTVLRLAEGVSGGQPAVSAQGACRWLLSASESEVEQWLALPHTVVVRESGCILTESAEDARRCSTHGLDEHTGAVVAALTGDQECSVTREEVWRYDLCQRGSVTVADLVLAALQIGCRLARSGLDAQGWTRARLHRTPRARPARPQEAQLDRGLHWYARWKIGSRHPGSLRDCALCGSRDYSSPCRTCVEDQRWLERFPALPPDEQLACLPVLLSVGAARGHSR